jgi:hypothetical protein
LEEGKQIPEWPLDAMAAGKSLVILLGIV